MNLIPTTILTGFLGAGKTTLLNRILQEQHGYKIAIIENEFGEENIDSEILVQGSAEQIVEMRNGCICCTVRGDLVEALGTLAQKREAGELGFDYLVIETTGLADPGPVAQTFFMDETIAGCYLIDAVITVVDAVHGMQQLDQNEEARLQVGFADRLLLSKSDIADPAAVSTLTERLRRINPRAPVVTADFGCVPFSEILDQRGFNLNDKLDIEPAFLGETPHAHDHACTGAGCTHTHHHAAMPFRHLDDIAAFAFTSERPFDNARLEDFLSAMIDVYGQQMLRYKGILYIAGAEGKIVFQGVHQLFGSDADIPWRDDEVRGSKMVFIGKNLPKTVFLDGLTQCLV